MAGIVDKCAVPGVSQSCSVMSSQNVHTQARTVQANHCLLRETPGRTIAVYYYIPVTGSPIYYLLVSSHSQKLSARFVGYVETNTIEGS